MRAAPVNAAGAAVWPPHSVEFASARPAMPLLPVGLRVEGRSVLVVGAGRVAARKARSLIEQGALITVVAPEHGLEMDGLAVAVRHHREFVPGDLDGHWFVVTATGDAEVDGEVFGAAELRRVWCNSADDPQHCSVVLPAVVRRGDITVSVASGGRSPAVASWLRRRIEGLIDDDTLTVLEIAARVRTKLRASGLPTEVAGWETMLDCEALDLVSEGRASELEARLGGAVGVTERPSGGREPTTTGGASSAPLGTSAAVTAGAPVSVEHVGPAEAAAEAVRG